MTDTHQNTSSVTFLNAEFIYNSVLRNRLFSSGNVAYLPGEASIALMGELGENDINIQLNQLRNSLTVVEPGELTLNGNIVRRYIASTERSDTLTLVFSNPAIMDESFYMVLTAALGELPLWEATALAILDSLQPLQ